MVSLFYSPARGPPAFCSVSLWFLCSTARLVDRQPSALCHCAQGQLFLCFTARLVERQRCSAEQSLHRHHYLRIQHPTFAVRSRVHRLRPRHRRSRTQGFIPVVNLGLSNIMCTGSCGLKRHPHVLWGLAVIPLGHDVPPYFLSS